MEQEVKKDVFDSSNLLVIVTRNWKPLLIVAILAAIGSVIVSDPRIMHEKYKATVTLFSAQNNNLSRGFLSMQADDTKDYLAFGEENSCEQMLQVLKSDALMYALEKKYDLYNRYGIAGKWDEQYLLKGIYSEGFVYDISEYESVQVIVYDGDPHKAAEMANGAVQLADSIYRSIIRQRAVAAYKVVKSQYDSAIAVSHKLQDTLTFYHNLGILQWQYQVDELTAGYTDAVVDNNVAAQKTITDKLKVFQQYGNGFLMITNELEATFEWLKQARASYMQAQANAQQAIPAFFIADKAVASDRKAYPIRGLVVAGGTITALFFALLVLLIINRVNTIKKK